MKKHHILNTLVFALILGISVPCSAMTLNELGSWHTGKQLPAVENGISKLIASPDITAEQKVFLSTFKEKIAQLSAVEAKLEASSKKLNLLHDELNKIVYKGVNEQGNAFTSSGHMSPEGKKRFDEASMEQRGIISEAVSLRAEVKAMVSQIKSDLGAKLQAVLPTN